MKSNGETRPRMKDKGRPGRFGLLKRILELRWFRNLKVGVKLTLGFATVAIIAGAIGAVGTLNIYRISRAEQAVYQNNIAVLGPLQKIYSHFQTIRTNTAYHLLARDDKAVYENLIVMSQENIDLMLGSLTDSEQANDQVQNDLSSLKKALANYWEAEQAVLQLSNENKIDEAMERMDKELKPLASLVGSVIDSLFRMNENEAKNNTESNLAAATDTIWFMLIMVGVGMAAAVGLGAFISRLISRPMKDLTGAAEKLAVGDVEVAIAVSSKDEIGILTGAFAKMVDSIREQAGVAGRIAAGDLEVAVKVKSDQDLLAGSMRVVVETLRNLIAEIGMLTGTASEGRLDIRGDAEKFAGDYRQVIEGVNATLDAVVGPLSMAAACVDQIGRGEIPALITDEYRGDFNTIKNSLNACITGLGALTESNGVLQRLAYNDYTQKVEGDYQGIYGEIAAAINTVRDRLLQVQRVFVNMAGGDLGDLDDLKQIGRLSENDQLMPSFIQMMETIRVMVDESLRLSEAAAAGRLEERGDAGKFAGEYRRVIEGFNATLDAVIAPLTEAGAVLGKLAVNDYTQAMTGQYQGLLQEFAAQINRVREQLLSVQDVFVRISRGDISRLGEFRGIGQRSANDQLVPAATAMMQVVQDLIVETEIVAQAAAAGHLEIRGDAAKLDGKYREIVAGMNQALDRMAEPISEAMAVLEKMAQGDLARTMDGEYLGDYGRIQEALNRTIASFNRILREINAAAGEVASASRRLSEGSQTLSEGATEQAATVQELSVAIETIAAQTKQNAEQARQAATLAVATQKGASQGNERMREMLAAMEGINDATDSISNIIKVIDEIAFQTNILALNAAVEAARAGGYGKGFAVVAEEVRNLAGRSAQAARETTELIASSVRKATDGAQIASQTAASLSQIVADVTRAAGLVEGIAAASNAQATGITQVNQAISQVAQVTQANTATSEESASASEELFGQAENLRQLVGRFRLEE